MTTHQPPFLTTRADGSLAYQATAPGNLRKLFETVRQTPELALEIKQLALGEPFDGQQDSELLDFVLEYSTTAYIEATTADDCESASDGCEDDWEEPLDTIDDFENDEQEQIGTANDDHIVTTAPSVTADYPVPLAGTLPTVPELSESFNIVVDIDEKHEKDSVTTNSSTQPSPAEILQTAMDDFMALAALTGIDHPIPNQFYLKLLFAMLSACSNAEVMKIPEGWARGANKDVFQDLQFVVETY
ncbi:hypothetical protein BU25DRAFT_488992 [Macroventuria anomochaeta]|uniref:Uncharacterized protein n=1 Tax=Macroventuria anomochaeta TaxID=301207 RepID=A0ACB6S9I0_9PLEO|nr:uncharacterized protein BU25DRAFT_488992 [Macroventuria anomochaeta]KAF2630871.1 hypothetical protein BU25DRAFT_488992 [Macroventuria anomochaeta]